MGLDMFLTKIVYVGAQYSHNNISGDIEVYKTKASGEKVRLDHGIKKLAELKYAAMYWRKANQIHNWFVVNVQDGVDNGTSHEVSADQLKDLLSLCIDVRNVLDKYKQDTEDEIKFNLGNITPEDKIILDLLPPVRGFFFGNYDINSWYYNDIVDTIEYLESEDLDSDNFDVYWEYISSW